MITISLQSLVAKNLFVSNWSTLTTMNGIIFEDLVILFYLLPF